MPRRFGELGQKQGSKAQAAAALRYAEAVWPVVQEIRASGAVTLRAIAEELNARGVPRPRGGRWSSEAVRLVMERAGS